jgi:hypothetical protein
MADIIIRGFADGQLVFRETLAEEKVDQQTAARHIDRLLGTGSTKVMLELEFTDMPEEQRFLRFGSDTRGMVQPIRYDPTKRTEPN